jgi:hypothetical protein
MALTNVASGATKVTKVLNAVNQEVTIWCAGQSKAGISITSVTGTPTLAFLGSTDGLQFNPITVATFPSAMSSAQGSLPASGIQSTTAAGNYEINVQNYQFIRVQMTAGAGPATVVIGASVDSSYTEVFLTGPTGVSLGILYPSTSSSAGTNTMTIPGQTGRTINITYMEVSIAGPGFGGNAQLRIWDNAVGNGVPLYSCYLTSPVGSVGTVQLINLPTDEQGNKGLQSPVPGNALVVQVINLGNTSAIINARQTYK